MPAAALAAHLARARQFAEQRSRLPPPPQPLKSSRSWRQAKRWFWLAVGAGQVVLAQQLFGVLRDDYGESLVEMKHEFLARNVLHVAATQFLYW